MSVSNVATTKSTATQTFDILGENTNHQLTLQAFEAGSPATPLNPSSGVVTVSYRPVGSTAYASMAATVDLSSGVVVSLFSGSYNSIQLTSNQGSSTLLKANYAGWKA